MPIEISSTSYVAEKAKTSAALSSVIAAVALTVLKLALGLATHSLGILAEALHSGHDLVAALVTYLAVRSSGKFADEKHLLDRGKVEQVSALIGALLLLVTCSWIVHEGIRRLTLDDTQVDASVWAFLAMSISVVVDVMISRRLYGVARERSSQALEADALHFRTDIWSSSIVVFGLVGVRLAAGSPHLGFLDRADAVAALVVASMVVYVSVASVVRATPGLLDRGSKEIVLQVEKVVESVPGILGCHRVRVRPAGALYFVDAHVIVSADQTLDEVHALTHHTAQAIRQAVPNADVIIHAEPPVRARPV